ncbi:hypothetical protein H6P81_008635 [Aristolochia fimbriata]|uniref:Glycosyltransferase n=1 Tax=Aristolochia fimbriata TaxID=158543 RepID=A0AAV7EIL1_ARIFI|nr:hypothetical protein H6P81_008635 [Aristolochia fimbriata]
MTQGHMIPMIDMARLFARRGPLVTVITTPANAARFESTIARDVRSGLPLRLHTVPFPSAEVGLPEGCENVDTLPSFEAVSSFFVAVGMLQGHVERFLAKAVPRPSCIVSDMGFPWTNETARRFNIPRFVFHGTSCFYLLCNHGLRLHGTHESVESDSELFAIPGVPERFKFSRSQLPDSLIGRSQLVDIRRKMAEAESKVHGVVVNSFDALEPEFVPALREATGKKAWTLGPVSLCNENVRDKIERGNKASVDENDCLRWLDSKKPKSVVYACFGSLCRLGATQLIELGLGLEASNRDFVWVIRNNRESSSEMDEWLSREGFEERVKDRGLVIRGWAPQVLILAHPATGAFLTHCGWNSTLEGVSAGVPLISWPLGAEQFFNEKVVVNELRIGVSVGAEEAVRWGVEKAVKLVGREGVKQAVEKVMGPGEEGERIRLRAAELGAQARQAMEEGGSSDLNMTLLLESIKEYPRNGEVLESEI